MKSENSSTANMWLGGPTVPWSTFMNFGLFPWEIAGRQLQTSMRVPLHLPQVPRPLSDFAVSRTAQAPRTVDSWQSVATCTNVRQRFEQCNFSAVTTLVCVPTAHALRPMHRSTTCIPIYSMSRAQPNTRKMATFMAVFVHKRPNFADISLENHLA